MSNRTARLRAALLGRSTLVVFAALAVGAFLPGVVPTLAPVLYPLVLPSYLVTMVVYDGGLLEAVIYALEPVVPLDGGLLWDLGQAVVLYLFTVVAALLGGVLSRRFGPDRETTRARVRIRYLVAGGLLVIGVGLVVQGVVSQPTVTSVTCEGNASASGANGSATPTPDCTRTTESAPGQRFYVIGLGGAIGLLGGAVVATDRWLARRRR